MPSRKIEVLDLDKFIVGEPYSRPDIATIGKVAPLESSREWTGIVEFANCIVLFSTLEKKDLSDEYNYADVFSSDSFFWESQNRNTQSSPAILKLISLEAPVLLFCRLVSKVGSETQPFVYVGILEAEDYDSEKPVQMRFNVVNYVEGAPSPLRQLYEWRPEKERVLKPLEDPDREPKIRSGQGRVVDPKKRKAIELRAMSMAVEHYENQGFSVIDTSSNNPFDLECSKREETIRVEVKGLSGSFGNVEVTIGEVRSALNESIRTDLFIVHSISLLEKNGSDLSGVGGTIHIENDWQPAENQLEAIRFRYSPN